jgi:hypothetical protein
MKEPVYHVVEDVFEDAVRSFLRGLSSLNLTIVRHENGLFSFSYTITRDCQSTCGTPEHTIYHYLAGNSMLSS